MASVPLARWNRLGIKVAAAITLVSVATVGVFVILVLRTQRRHLTEQAVRGAAMVSDTIASSIDDDMLHDRRAEAYRVMDAIGRDDQIDGLRVFDGAGRVRYSTRPEDVGRTADTHAPSCRPCHANASRSASVLPERTRIIERDGRRLVSVVTPFYNRPWCSAAACHAHPASQRVIGVLELGVTLAGVDQQTAGLTRTTILLGVLANLVLAGVTWVLMRTLVVVKVEHLLAGTQRVRAGELGERVPVGSADELGTLERSFNEMERSLAAARAQRDALLDSLEKQVRERTAALERAQEQLIQTEKLSSLGRLSASIAHEINNPLAGILTTAKLLLRGTAEELDETRRASLSKSLRLIEREANRCTAIVRNLLGFARERPLAISSADVNAALEEALFLVANQVALQNITLERQLVVLPPIDADFGQLRQAFANILINARDAMPHGGTLCVRSARDGAAGAVRVEIRDSGVGIPKDVLNKVLDPFFTTKEKGTGLGLSVVYGIVKRHGGHLEIASEPGAGTTIAITLPEHPAKPPQPPVPLATAAT